jgi:hypothetical protein
MANLQQWAVTIATSPTICSRTMRSRARSTTFSILRCSRAGRRARHARGLAQRPRLLRGSNISNHFTVTPYWRRRLGAGRPRAIAPRAWRRAEEQARTGAGSEQTARRSAGARQPHARPRPVLQRGASVSMRCRRHPGWRCGSLAAAARDYLYVFTMAGGARLGAVRRKPEGLREGSL